MAGEILLRCVPDPQQGAGVAPCPSGYIISTVETQLPDLLDGESAMVIAGTIAVPLIIIFAIGLVFGWLSKGMLR